MGSVNKRIAKVLRDARALLAKRGGWGQGNFAYNSLGFPEMIGSSHAVCFCSMGAIKKVAPTNDDAQNACLAVANTLAGRNIIDWNDQPGRRKAQVLAAFDNAIAACEA